MFFDLNWCFFSSAWWLLKFDKMCLHFSHGDWSLTERHDPNFWPDRVFWVDKNSCWYRELCTEHQLSMYLQGAGWTTIGFSGLGWNSIRKLVWQFLTLKSLESSQISGCIHGFYPFLVEKIVSYYPIHQKTMWTKMKHVSVASSVPEKETKTSDVLDLNKFPTLNFCVIIASQCIIISPFTTWDNINLVINLWEKQLATTKNHLINNCEINCSTQQNLVIFLKNNSEPNDILKNGSSRTIFQNAWWASARIYVSYRNCWQKKHPSWLNIWILKAGHKWWVV